MARFAFTALTLFLCFIAFTDASCYSKCRFVFCNRRSSFKVGVQTRYPFTGRICLPGTNLGHIDSTGEAYNVDYYPVPISKYYPYGLKQKFSPSFFKSLRIRGHFAGRKIDFSGVGHEKPQNNQGDFLNQKCWALPVTAYQVLDNNGYVIANKHPRRPLVDCVAFKTRTH